VEGVEPTNNVAERTIRHAGLYRKGCFGTHSEAGSRFVERILTVVATLRQQDRNVMEYLTEACTCAMAGKKPPSMLPCLSGWFRRPLRVAVPRFPLKDIATPRTLPIGLFCVNRIGMDATRSCA